MALAPLSSDAVLTPEQRAARRAAANTPPPGTSIVGPTAGKNPLAFGTGNTFNVGEGQEVRVVDAGGNVIFSGAGAEGANRAVAVAQSLSDELGGNADFKIQTGERTINPDGSVGGTRYIDVARAAPSQSGLGFLADYVLPYAATFIPGVGPVLGAALGAGASSAAQGRSLQDTLTRAAIAAGTAGLVQGTQLDKTIGGALSNTGGQAAGQAAGRVGAQALGATGGDIVVSGLSKAVQAAGGALGSAALSQAGNALARELSGYKTPAEKFAEQPVQPPLESNVVNGIDQNNGEIVVSKYRPINPPGGFDPVAVAAAIGLPVGSILDSLGPLNTLPSDPALMQPETLPEDIVVNAPIAVTPETGLPVGSVLAGLGLISPPTPDPALTEKGGILGTGLNLPQLISIGGVGADLLKNLLGGGDGTGTGAPYVSPFGTGVGFARGQDMRVNPNIADYEQYGFGPEAMFFRPEYSGLVSAGAPAPQAQPAMTTNPRYEPLI